MAQQTVNNGDTGLVSRTKINDNFSELYGAAVAQLWQLVGTVVKPVSDRDVETIALKTVTLNVNDALTIAASGEVISGPLAAVTTGKRSIRCDSTGKLIAEMIGSMPAEHRTANITLDEDDYSVLINTTSAEVTVTLPVAATHEGKAYLIKLNNGNNAVVVQANGGDLINDGAREGSVYNIASVGQWAKIRCIDGKWYVEAAAGRATGGDGASVRGVTVVDDDHSISTSEQAIIANTSTKHVEVSLPQIGSVGVVDFTIRHAIDGNALTLLRSGTDIIQLNDAGVTGFTTTTKGAWLRVMNDGGGIWWITEGGKDWTNI